MRHLLAASLIGASAAHAGCGLEDASCEIAGGTYEIVLPQAPQPDMPALMFVHGWGSSGAGVLRLSGMVETFTAAGFAVIAPTGTPRQGRGGYAWGFHPDFEQPRDETAFLIDVRDDAASRFGIDPARVILSGFSIGGSMTAYVACAEPDAFAAYAPVGGNFWRPHPETCAGPVRMLHTHGWTDKTVPLEGRVLRGADLDDPNSLVQGDIFHAMGVWRATNGCDGLRADRFVTEGPFWRRVWDDCAPGSALELALFPGGHSIPAGWAEMALEWFQGLDTGG